MKVRQMKVTVTAGNGRFDPDAAERVTAPTP